MSSALGGSRVICIDPCDQVSSDYASGWVRIDEITDPHVAVVQKISQKTEFCIPKQTKAKLWRKVMATVASLQKSINNVAYLQKPDVARVTDNEIDISGYEINRVIAQGGMSTVYLATQKSLRRHVALKVMTPALAASPDFTERFRTEGEIVAELTHPNIVTIFDIGLENQNYYLTMEYLGGGNLGEKIQQGLSVERSLKIIKIITAALSFAHSRGIVHRDIKPQNILFRDDDTPILADFGIAKITGEDNPVRTAPGLWIGSPLYMSPEQVNGQMVDGRSDLYSLGILLYELLTGCFPFKAASQTELARMHVNEPIPELPLEFADFQPILDRLTAKNPDERFESAEAFIAALEKVESQIFSPNDASISIVEPKVSGSRLRTENPVPVKWIKSIRSLKASLVAISLGVFGSVALCAALLTADPEKPVIKEANNLPIVHAEPRILEPDPKVPEPPEEDDLSVLLDEPQQPETNTERRQTNEKAENIEQLLVRGQMQLKRRHLTTPRDDNALDTYRRVLSLDPGNQEAMAGLKEIVRRYRQLAEYKMHAGQLKESLKYIDRGLQVASRLQREFGASSNDADLRALRSMVREMIQKKAPQDEAKQLYARAKRLIQEAKTTNTLSAKQNKIKESQVLIKRGLEKLPGHAGLLKLRFEAWSLDSEIQRRLEKKSDSSFGRFVGIISGI